MVTVPDQSRQSGDSYTYAYIGDGQLYEMKDVSGGLLYRYTYDMRPDNQGTVL